MENVIIASLGESPIVVTAMYNLLTTEEKQHEIGKIDKVIVLYPKGQDDIILLGYDLVEEALKGRCELEPWPLPFEDANSEDTSFDFLRLLFQLLYSQQELGNTVYLSLAGGRKNMSALMALVVPFFSCVKKLYHVLDKDEHSPDHTFKSIEELYDLPDANRKSELSPNLDQLILVDIPYTEQPVSDELRGRLLTITDEGLDALWEQDAPLAETAQLYREAVSKPNLTGKILRVLVTERVREKYELMKQNDEQQARHFAGCFERMRFADEIGESERRHDIPGRYADGSPMLFHFYRPFGKLERPFYYTRPEGINRYPNADVREVIICGLSVEQKDGQQDGSYKPTAEQLLNILKSEQTYPVETLFPTKSVLLVPLGASPMVATQLYVLLKDQGHLIQEVILLYPERSQVVSNSAKLARTALMDSGVACRDVVVKDYADIDSSDACMKYQQVLEATIQEVKSQKQYLGCQIDLALSGGRKGMAALAMFAARREHIPYVYHTLINDDTLSQRVDGETTIKVLNRESKKVRADRLFLRAYEGEGPYTKFVLFKVPVVPLSADGN